MKKLTITLALAFAALAGFAQTKTDTSKRYVFNESEVILIDNLIGQLDIVSGNSDKVSTSQYNQLHRAVMHVDSLIKIQWAKKHPVKEQPKKP